MYTINDFAMMEPMKYYNSDDANNKKRQAMVGNENENCIASVKHDGDWGMFIHYTKGVNLVRSRSISKVTGAYGDYTEKVPHLVAEMDNWPDNTVVLAELCFEETGANANTVGTILRCLPAKAIERQKTNPLYAYVFDILMFAGVDLTSTPYEKRLVEYAAEVTGLVPQDYTAKYFKRTEIVYSDFEEAADRIISAGGEGLVIQLKDNCYWPGTRTAWKTLKLKQSLPEMELKVLGTLEPNKYYEGDCPNTWEYKIDGVNVTKPYFYHWKNGVTVQYNDTTTDVASGLTDEDREWLATPEAQTLIKSGGLYAVVKAMSTNDLGKLRHPYLVRFRTVEDGVEG